MRSILQKKIHTLATQTLTVLLVLFVVTVPFKALSQYDFNGDGIDELLHVAQTEEGIIKWQALDPVTGENDLLGYFGQADNQLAVGNWLQPEKPEIGVITHGEQGKTGKNGRSQLKVPLNLSNNTDVLNAYVQRKEQDLIISGADFDGNGLADIAVVQNRGKRKALWRVMLNPLASEQSKKRRLALGVSTDKPFTFFFRPGKESLAQLRVPKANKRALVIYHCRWPCKRQARVRISQELVVGDHIKLQVLRGGSGSLSAENSSPRPDALVFISETANDQELTFFNNRGRPERKQSATKGAAIVLGKFGQSEIIEIINGQAQLYSNLTGEKVVFAAKVNQPLSNNVIDYHTQGATEQTANQMPLPLVPTTTPTPLPTITDTLPTHLTPTPTASQTPTISTTSTPIPTLTPTFTLTSTPSPTNLPTLTPTPSSDPYANNVVLMLKGEGSDGSTTITDSSPNTKSITTIGNAQLSVNQSKHGVSSIYFDGSGDYLTTPITLGGELDFRTADFTWEAWVYPTDLTYTRAISLMGIARANSFPDYGVFLTVKGQYSNNPLFRRWVNEDSAAVANSTLPINQWSHIAGCRRGLTYEIYLNGIKGTSGTLTSSSIQTTDKFYIGYSYNNSGFARDFAGYIDSLRLTQGVARYTTTFNPETDTFLK